jgi:hypothetical protein
MYGLTKIILVGSYLKRPTILDVKDNTNIRGTNGVGKTTTAKLFPYFYGASPGSLVENGKLSFPDWYLPHSGSFIVYEYMRESGKCCVITYRDTSGRSSNYRFLSSSFNIEHFSILEGDKTNFMKVSDLWRHWTSLGLTFSRQIESTTEYKAILQNDKQYIRRDPEKIRMAAQYCLGHTGSSLKHIDKVALSMVNGRGELATIKAMVAEIMSEDGLKIPALNLHRDNGKSVDDIKTLRDFKNSEDSIRNTVQLGEELDDIDSNTRVIVSSLRAAEKQQAEIHAESSKRVESISTQVQEMTSAWEVRQSELTLSKSESKSEADTLERDVNNLQAQADRWDNMEIEKLSAKYDSLATYQEAVRAAESRHDFLLKDLEEIESKFSEQEHKLFQGFTSAKDSVEERVKGLRVQRAGCESNYNAQKDSIKLEQEKRLEGVRSKHRIEREAASEEMHQLQARHDNTPYTEEEKLSIAAAEQALERASDTLDASKRAEDASLDQVRSKKAGFDAADRNRAQQLKTEARLNAEFERLEDLLNPDDKSLLHALRSSFPGWQETIGRVIHPDLLARRDLQPEKLGDSESIFGLSLKTSAIDPPDYAEKESELRLKLEAKRSEVDAAAHQTKALTNEMSRAEKALRTATEEASNCTSKRKADDASLSACRHSLKLETLRAKEALAERKIVLERQLKAAKSALTEMRDRHSDEESGLIERYAEKLSEALSIWSQNDCRFSDTIDENESRIRDLANCYKEDQKTLKADLREARKAGGVDDERIAKAKKELDGAIAAVKKIESDRPLVLEYRTWKADRWSQMTLLSERAGVAAEAFATALTNLEKEKADHDKERKSLQDQKTAAEKSLRQVKEIIENIRLVTKHHPQYAVEPKEASIDALLAEYESEQKRKRETETKVKKGVDRAIQIIERYPQSQIMEAWRVIQKDNNDEIDRRSGHMEAWRLCPRGLKQLLDDSIPQAKRLAVDTFKSLGDSLYKYFCQLGLIRSLIAKQSREISDVVDSRMFFNDVTDIRLKLVSKVEEFDFWPDLCRFGANWTEWLSDGGMDIPNETLQNAFADAVSLMKQAQITSEVSSLFDFHISMKDKGRDVEITNDKQLANVSSNGLSYLTLCSIMAGITRKLCPDTKIKIHWPIDELSTIHPTNVRKLFDMLKSVGIVAFGAEPDPNTDMLKMFDTRYCLNNNRGLVAMDIKKSELDEFLEEESGDA